MNKERNKKIENDTDAVSKSMSLFADMLIEKIEHLTSGDKWEKPWFSTNSLGMPKNMNGRMYNGMNSLMLIMCCEKNGYTIPRFCTFDCVQRMNKNEENKDLPRVSILKGEKSFPVLCTTFTCINKETKEKIPYDDYKNRSEDERDKYSIYPKFQTFRVFNVAQTNLKEARPELWARLEAEYAPNEELKEHSYSFTPVDDMITRQTWICPIKPTHGDEAYFSISKNQIVVPEKGQFKDGESYYTSLFHEMAHSTGHESQLGRVKPASFGSKDYAREELVAELTAALTAQHYGMVKNLKEDSACYLKAWLDSLKEEPQFIRSTLIDVKKAFAILFQHIDCQLVSTDKDVA